MFSNYLIQEVNGEEVLYLYMTYQYDFSKEFGSYSEKDLRVLSRNFIQMNHIPFKGNKVYFVVDGFVVKSIDSCDSDSLFYSPDQYLIVLKLEDSSLCEITLRQYLQSILFSKYSQELGDEVLKCICVLFNTYSFYSMSRDGFIYSNNPFGYFIPLEEYKEKYHNYEAIVERINSIIDHCSCMFLAYQKEYILPFIHYCNGGRTLSNIKYPYLTSVKSLWDMASPNYLTISDYGYDTLSNILNVKLDSNSTISVLQNGCSLKFGYKTFSIYEIKNLLKLKSNDISIIANRSGVRFITKGIGDGLGLSIYGASCIEENGSNFEEILKYYFPKCTLYKNIKELS